MKGFIHLIELAVVGFIILISISMFLSIQKSSLSWERADLIGIGNDVMNNLEASGSLNDFSSIEDKITEMLPPNIEFGLKVKGTIKDDYDILVYGQIEQLGSFKDSSINGRTISFDIDQTDDVTTYNFSDYDAVIISKVDDITPIQNKIIQYLNNSGTVIAVNSDPKTGYDEIFNLTRITETGGDESMNFTKYNPYENNIVKYFFSFGSFVETPIQQSNYMEGNWNDQNKAKVKNYLDYVNIDGVSGNLVEGETFIIRGDLHRIKKIDSNGVHIAISNKNLTFDLSSNRIDGNKIIGTVDAGMTQNGNAIWVAFGDARSESYDTLIKAAVVSNPINEEWYVRTPSAIRSYVAVPKFFTGCCDYPEPIELSLILWYSY